MTEHDRDAFAKAWTAAMKLYGKAAPSIDASTLNLTFEALRFYELSEVTTALTAHLRNPDTGQYAPKPADIIRQLSGNSETRANEAWFKVERAIRCVGQYRTVVFDDPWIHAAVVRLGGWVKTAEVTSQELPFLRNNFLSIYRGFTVQPPESHPAKLLGVCEHANQGLAFERGTDKDKPAVIGNVEAARRVYKQGGGNGVAITHQGIGALLDGVTRRLGADDGQADAGL